MKRLLTAKRAIVGDGEGCCEVIDRFGRPVAWIWYRRPTSNDRLDFAYQQQNALTNSESGLREIRKAENKAKKLHELMLRDLHIPFAERVFVGCAGYVRGDGTKVESLARDDQFVYMKTNHAEHLTDMVSQVFAVEGIVKKKY
jgi:hypothetical protein